MQIDNRILGRKRDLEFHFISWGIGFIIFLWMATHQQAMLGAVIWYGFPTFYHFAIRRQFNVRYKKGIYDPRKGVWLTRR